MASASAWGLRHGERCWFRDLVVIAELGHDDDPVHGPQPDHVFLAVHHHLGNSLAFLFDHAPPQDRVAFLGHGAIGCQVIAFAVA